MKKPAFVVAAACVYLVVGGFVVHQWQTAPGPLETFVTVPLGIFLFIAVTSALYGMWSLLND